MKFSSHFDDIKSLINEDKSVGSQSYTLYGSKEQNTDYNNPFADVVQFWSLDEGDDDIHSKVVLNDVLYIENSFYELDDLHFHTQCVGYAVENNYKSVIIESPEGRYCMTLNFNGLEDSYYLTEAPLSGVKLSPAQRKASQDKKKAKYQPKGDIRRPGKAPSKGMKVDILLANTGKLSPDRVERAMKQVRKQPPKLSGVKEVGDQKYFRAEYSFTSMGSSQRQLGYADVSQNKEYCNELFCSCGDFFYRLYAPYVAAGLSTWKVPSKYKGRQNTNVKKAPHNHRWTEKTNPMGKLFLCKHLWAFLAYYVAGDAGNTELSDEEIDDVISQYFDDVDGAVDDEDQDEFDVQFAKAFGKLYVNQKGKDIEHIDNKEDVKKSDRKQTFYQLPVDRKDNTEPEEEEVDDGEE